MAELIVEIFLPCVFCHRYYKKKNKLRQAGYTVDAPLDYYINSQNYSVKQTHGILDVTTYAKYGTTYTLEEILNKDYKTSDI